MRACNCEQAQELRGLITASEAHLRQAEELLDLVESAPDEWFAEYRAFLAASEPRQGET